MLSAALEPGIYKCPKSLGLPKGVSLSEDMTETLSASKNSSFYPDQTEVGSYGRVRLPSNLVGEQASHGPTGSPITEVLQSTCSLILG